jgi:hypothetical protein
MVETEPVVRELHGQSKDRRRVSLSPEFGNDDVPYVTAYPLEKVVEPVTYRYTPDDAFTVESKQECGWNVIRRKIHASLPLFEDFEIATERHALFVIVKEVRHFGCGSTVCPHELVFFVLSRPTKHQHLWHG